MQKHEWTSNIMLSEKLRLKRQHALWLHSHDILKKAQVQGQREHQWSLRITDGGSD